MFGESCLAREDDNINRILRHDYVILERRQARICNALPTKVALRSRGREDFECDEDITSFSAQRIALDRPRRQNKQVGLRQAHIGDPDSQASGCCSCIIPRRTSRLCRIAWCKPLGDAFKIGSPSISSHFSLSGRVSVKEKYSSTVIGPVLIVGTPTGRAPAPS